MRQFAWSALATVAIACGGAAPKSAEQRNTLEDRAELTVRTMTSRDPSLRQVLDSAAGYVVFPEIGKGGLVVGAAHGRGILYENGRSSGFVELRQASIGAQAGAQTFAELIVFTDPADVQEVKSGTYDLGGSASAVVLSAGVAAATDFSDGVAVFVLPRGGVMAELSITGQQLRYSPEGG